MNTLYDLFEAYGDKPTEALAAWANVDPDAWSKFTDEASENRYHADFRRWLGRQVATVKADALKQASGQARLFEPPDSGTLVELREWLLIDGEQVRFIDLEGRAGASLIRKVMTRDLKPALTTVNRCKYGLALADHIETESDRLGRDVAVHEVVTLGEAA